MAPQDTQQLAGLTKEQARTFINQWKGRWDARVAHFKTRVDNSQATLAQNPGRCPAVVRAKFQTSINQTIRGWEEREVTAEKWYKDYYNSLQTGGGDDLRGRMKTHAQAESNLAVESNWIMEEQIW